MVVKMTQEGYRRKLGMTTCLLSINLAGNNIVLSASSALPLKEIESA